MTNNTFYNSNYIGICLV
ncbi:MAG: hypothetical protein ACFFCM_12800 [Promethearchaeota archaeon]